MNILTRKNGFVFPGSATKNTKSVEKSLPKRLSKLNPQIQLESGTWQQHLKWAIRSENQLRELLGLSAQLGQSGINGRPRSDRPTLELAAESGSPETAPDNPKNLPQINAVDSFPVFVPLPFLARINPGDPRDPLLRQVLPTLHEDQITPGYSADPLGEEAATLRPGLLHKYHGRVLLVTTGACAVNCRYCFRRHFPYQESPKSPRQWTEAIETIAADDSIEEVILSGGDPLTLVDENLSQLIARLADIGHLKRLRLHTRLPIMIPQRITSQFVELISQTRLQTIVVIHSNHANELDDAVQEALRRLTLADVMLLNQSVLLQGVNDDLETLVNLSERLLECRVMPYYLHKNDPIAGTAHFEVSAERGMELIEQMRANLPGYAVPRFVQEIAGEPNKTVLA